MPEQHVLESRQGRLKMSQDEILGVPTSPPLECAKHSTISIFCGSNVSDSVPCHLEAVAEVRNEGSGRGGLPLAHPLEASSTDLE
jgi:hypothetical protein